GNELGHDLAPYNGSTVGETNIALHGTYDSCHIVVQ
ncbi:hypothetical protein CCACVL1_02464, partial [Corchorus capsularis]